MAGKFDLRPGEVTLWAGINKHGKTTFLSQVMLNLMREGQKVCVASMEMKPRDSMLKMTKQAAGVEKPSTATSAPSTAGRTASCGSTTTSAGSPRAACWRWPPTCARNWASTTWWWTA
jgi:ABC-type hemin transport system ATPase subunit